MNNWGTAREVEKPKTLAGKRAQAIANGESAYVKLMQLSESSRALYGDSAPLRAPMIAAASALRELIDLMPGGKA
jgi:hypothetical protein